MSLAHRLLNLMRVGVDDEMRSFGEREIRPSTLKDMSNGKELNYAVFLCDRHNLVVCFQCRIILSIGEHHSLRVARSA